MLFTEFQKKLAERRAFDTESLNRTLRDLANDYDLADDYETREECLDELSTEINEIFETYSRLPYNLDVTISLIADNLIQDFEDRLGIIHVFLRNVKHNQDDLPQYDEAMKERLSKRFTNIGVIDSSLRQFLSFEKNGSISLNVWGAFVLDRMEDNLVLMAYSKTDEAEFSQLYSVQDMIALGR